MSRRGHLDWQPGLSVSDFRGVYRISLREYERFASRAFAEHLFEQGAELEWRGSSPDARYLVQIRGATLAVAIDGSSTSVELGSLLDDFAGHRVMALGRDQLLTVYALPERDGAVALTEPGYIFGFRYRPDAREAWEVSVALVLFEVDMIGRR
ncbi:MAG: hypothetical protein R6X02_20105 [Enhygromyxa sp.]